LKNHSRSVTRSALQLNSKFCPEMKKDAADKEIRAKPDKNHNALFFNFLLRINMASIAQKPMIALPIIAGKERTTELIQKAWPKKE
jgi:hypothetical protein